MSLLERSARSCVRLCAAAAPDGFGGSAVSWQEGKAFRCCAVPDSGELLLQAGQDRPHSRWTILAAPDCPLALYDWFRDCDSGETFRVTAVPQERHTPPGAALQLLCFSAERKELPA